MVSAYNTTVTPCQERDYGDAQQTLTGGYCSNHFTAIEACKASTRCIAGPCGSKGVIFPADTAEEDSPNGYSDCAEWGPFCGIQTYCFFCVLNTLVNYLYPLFAFQLPYLPYVYKFYVYGFIIFWNS